MARLLALSLQFFFGRKLLFQSKVPQIRQPSQRFSLAGSAVLIYYRGTIAEKMVTRMPKARFILLPITDATRGHGTHTQAAVWKNDWAELSRTSELKP